MSADIAISVNNLTKTYHLYNKHIDRLKASLHPFGKKYYKEFNALFDVSLEIVKGDSVGVIGNNGSGKSTLLKIITGVLTPTSGSVSVNGKISAILELGSGFNQERTGMENIYFMGTLMGFSTEEMDNRLDSILGFADIGEFIYQPVKTYSSGMFVRLAFAVAINVDPEILIIDEALAVGDVFFQAKCMTALERFRRNGVSILFVSHNISSVKALCNQAVYLNQGKIVAQGEVGYVTSLFSEKSREEVNSQLSNFEVSSINKVIAEHNNGDVKVELSHKNGIAFKIDTEFAKRVAMFRNGTGEAKIVAVELIDNNENEISDADFDQIVNIRIYIQFEQSCNIAATYYIRDSSNTLLLGSTTILEGQKLINGTVGSKKIVEFKTKLPLQEGYYNLQVLLVSPIILNQASRYVDSIENALVFKVNQRRNIKIWSKTYIENSVTIYNFIEDLNYT